jgi:hypothetical protein
MSDRRKNPVTQFFVETESVRLTNWSLRIAAGLIALTMRLFTSIFLAVVRMAQRNRRRW